MKKMVSVLALTGALVVGSAGLAAAQEDPGAGPDAGTPPTAQHRRHRPIRFAAKVAAETIGISTDELKQELRAGKTIAQVAEEHGIAVDSVVNAIVEARTAKLRERAEKLVDHQFGGGE